MQFAGLARLAGAIRLTHPFPSLLDGLVVAGIAIVATGDWPTAVRLGISMTALQASIGSLNDLVDAPTDAGRKPGKPIPAHLVSLPAAKAIMIGAAGLGLAGAVPSGPALVSLAALVLGIGYGYDLLAKGTAWSWLPLAVGIPILPLYGWLGAAGTVPGWFVALLPIAVLAGTSLAIANASADVERDLAAGIGSIATHLGLERAWWAGLGLVVAALALAIGWLALAGHVQGVSGTLVGVGTLLVGIGVVLSLGSAADRRERGWQVQAIGIAIVGTGWIWAAAGA
ncbi:MAG: UbiA family prenyltransferase [Candidatus Limnocylindrales bacterium]